MKNRYWLIFILSVICYSNIVSDDLDLKYVNFLPELSACKDDKDKLNVTTKYLKGLKDNHLKEKVYWYIKDQVMDEKHSLQLYEIILKEGKREWAYEYLNDKGIDLGEKWAFEILMRLNNDDLKNYFVLYPIRNFTVVNFENDPDKFKEWFNTVIEALPELAKSDESQIVKNINNNNPWIKLFALNILKCRENRKNSILPFLVEFINDKNIDVSNFAEKKLKTISKMDYKKDYNNWRNWLNKIISYCPHCELSTDNELINGFEKGEMEVKYFALNQLCLFRLCSENKSILLPIINDALNSKDRIINLIAKIGIDRINRLEKNQSN